MEIVNSSNSLLFKDGNDLMKAEFLRGIVDENYYDDVDLWVDNVISVLDMVGLGAPVRVLRRRLIY